MEKAHDWLFYLDSVRNTSVYIADQSCAATMVKYPADRLAAGVSRRAGMDVKLTGSATRKRFALEALRNEDIAVFRKNCRW